MFIADDYRVDVSSIKFTSVNEVHDFPGIELGCIIKGKFDILLYYQRMKFLRKL